MSPKNGEVKLNQRVLTAQRVRGHRWERTSGHSSTAMGSGTMASGIASTALGRNTRASNDNATAMGQGSIASGWDSVAMGTATPVSALQVIGTVTATTFNPPSDRNLKENFSPVSPREVRGKVTALPISRWNFKGDSATPHVGRMAQDFHAAFGLGSDDKGIATVDADGVALAAIQGLNQKLEEQKAENAELKARLEKLERLVNETSGGRK